MKYYKTIKKYAINLYLLNIEYFYLKIIYVKFVKAPSGYILFFFYNSNIVISVEISVAWKRIPFPVWLTQ